MPTVHACVHALTEECLRTHTRKLSLKVLTHSAPHSLLPFMLREASVYGKVLMVEIREQVARQGNEAA